MAENPKELKYSDTHEWVRIDGDTITVGITDHAQHELGDVVYVELPEVGRTLTKDDSFGTVESVKAVSDLITPVTGEVLEINEDLVQSPELVNQDPYVAGWMIVLRVQDPSELDDLMTVDQYEAFIQE